MNISFENTESAFAYKSTKELRSAKRLFGAMRFPSIVSVGTRVTPMLVKTGLPLQGILRRTIFRQFVGGETLEQTIPVCEMLDSYNVKVILDYGVEGKETEEVFEQTTQLLIKTAEFAATRKNIPFISVKVTGLARADLLQALNEAPRLRSGMHSHEKQNEEWDRVRERVYRICAAAAEKKVGVQIDAEESWLQDPIDRLSMEMMEIFNKERIVVYNTIQLYRHDRLRFLELSHQIAREKGFKLGMKLVRGAYMEKERARAIQYGYTDPIQPDKEATDRDYDLSMLYCLEHVEDIAVIVATHNEESTMKGVEFMKQKGVPLDHPNVNFSQLYGMSDNITFNLAKAGVSVSKYLPYGSIRDVIPYLMRRAQENSSMGGQTGRELKLIRTELDRRKG